MNFAFTSGMDRRDDCLDWREALLMAFDLGLPRQLNFEWVLDRIENEDWSRSWR